MSAVRLVAVSSGFIVAALYLPHVLWGEWVYEDVAWLQGIQLVPAGWWMQPRGLFRALWVAEWQVSPTPQLFHAVSVGLHVAMAALTGIFVKRMGVSDAGALLAVMVVLSAAVGVEAVAYAAQQNELLAAVAVLVACIVAAGRWWRAPAWISIGLSLWIGILGKEAAVVGLLLVPLVIAAQARRYRDVRPRWAVAWMPAGVAAAAGFAGVLWLGGVRAVVNIGESLDARVTALDWLLVQSAAAVRTLGQLIIPLGLTVDYDYDRVPQILRWLSVGALVWIGWRAWLVHRTWPPVSLGLAMLLAVILPRLIIQTPRSYFNLHQAYLFLPCWGLIAGAVYDHWRARWVNA